MTVVANILDPIHDDLDARVWDNPEADEPTLKKVHREWIIATITDTLESAGYTKVEEWLSLVFTGSLTTYQYSDDSDVDVSLFVDAEVFPEWSRAEMIGVMVEHIDGTRLPGTPHPMQCFVVPPRVTKEMLYQPGTRSGYDLSREAWIVPPERDRALDVQAELNSYYVYALESADKMERLLRYEPEKAKLFWHQIHKRRRVDMQAGKGDYSLSNIVYKFLANRGLFPEIAELTGEYIAKVSETMIPAPLEHVVETAYRDTQETGGTTIGLSGKQPTTGFALSPFKNGETTIPENQFSPQSISEFISNNLASLSMPDYYLGAWKHEGLVYLDVTQVLADREAAIEAAINAEQLAIFDLDNFEEIPVLMKTASGGVSVRWLKQFGYLRNIQQQLEGIEPPVEEDAFVPVPQMAFSKVADTADELHIALQIPQHVRNSIREWVDSLEWPEGTKLEDPSEYHITLLYAPEGYERFAASEMANEPYVANVSIKSMAEFDGEGDGKAIVLLVDSADAKAHADALQWWIEEQGIEIRKFPGGYKPHLTLAYGPGMPEAEVPELSFKTERAEVSPPRTAKTAGMIDYAEYVDPSVLMPYREYDWSADHNRDGAESWEDLKADIATNGFREPAYLEFNHETGEAYLGEGNHRVGIAHELGIPVPVIVYRSTKTQERGYPMKPLAQPGQYSFLDDRGFSQFGQYEPPSKIGLPTVQPASPRRVGTVNYRWAAPQHKQVAKFVYHPPTGRVLVGEMGNEEGEKATHYQLAQMLGIEPTEGWYGQIGKNGWGEHLVRSIQFGPAQLGMNQYEAQYRIEKALSNTIPGVRWSNPSYNPSVPPGNPKWDEGDLQVNFVGEVPVIDGVANEPAPEMWDFS